MRGPEVKYAKDGDLHLAYQSWGSGPIDLVLVWGLYSHCELFWDDPDMAEFLESLGRFARVVQFDKRGTGMSDTVVGVPTLEERMDDARIVMDTVGMERVALFGESEGGATCCLFAATYPERVSHLVLYAPLFSLVHRRDFQSLVAFEDFDAFLEPLVEQWGTGVVSALGVPSRAGDPAALELCARFERFALTRGGFRDLMRANAAIDIDPVLPSVKTPTLVIHRTDDQMVSIAHGKHYAERIDGARFVAPAGVDHGVFAGDAGAVARETRTFLTGAQNDYDMDTDRVLTTVLFTDIVESTSQAAVFGDKRWRRVLDEHDKVVATEVTRARGRLVKSTGDGALATFDGPARGVRCATAIQTGLQRLGLDIRAGLHTGEVELRGDDIGGVAVHIGSRVAAAARAGEILTSRTVVDLVVGSGIEFVDQGEHTLKGVPGTWQLFAAHC